MSAQESFSPGDLVRELTYSYTVQHIMGVGKPQYELPHIGLTVVLAIADSADQELGALMQQFRTVNPNQEVRLHWLSGPDFMKAAIKEAHKGIQDKSSPLKVDISPLHSVIARRMMQLQIGEETFSNLPLFDSYVSLESIPETVNPHDGSGIYDL